MAIFSLEDVDNVVNKVEPYMAGASAIADVSVPLSGGTTAPIAIGINGANAVIDAYQLARAIHNRDSKTAFINGAELVASLAGTKAIATGSKYLRLDKALNTAGAPRRTITKTVGRGKGRHKITTTVEKEKGTNYVLAGATASGASDASPILQALNSYGDDRPQLYMAYPPNYTPQDKTKVNDRTIILKR